MDRAGGTVAKRAGALPGRSLVPRAVGTAAGAVVALWMGAQRSFTWQSYAGVSAICLFFLGWALTHRTRRLPAPERLHQGGVLAWCVPVLVLALLEVVDLVLGSTAAHPTLSSAMDPVLEHPLWRSAAVGVWMLAFRELVRR